jgi:hypothetical protein
LKLDECDGVARDTQAASLGTRFDVSCAEGRLGNAAVFPADVILDPQKARRIELAEEPRFDFKHELTVAAWVKPQGETPHRAIVSKWYSMDSFQLAIRNVVDAKGMASPRFSFSVAEPDGEWGRSTDVFSPEPVVSDVWTHVAGVYRWSADGQIGHIWLYVNGELVAETGTKLDSDGLQQSTRPIMIGHVESTGTFIGLIDDVRLYDVALGPELALLYAHPEQP